MITTSGALGCRISPTSAIFVVTTPATGADDRGVLDGFFQDGDLSLGGSHVCTRCGNFFWTRARAQARHDFLRGA